MIQEALTNVGKYAGVAEARVMLRETEREVEVRIVDEGRGFERETASKGVGLFSMEERARGVGGRLLVQSQPGKGTAVTLIVPRADERSSD